MTDDNTLAARERARAQRLADAIWTALIYLPLPVDDEDDSVPLDIQYARAVLEDAHRDAMDAALMEDANPADFRQGREL